MTKKEKNRIDAAANELIYNHFQNALQFGTENNSISEAYYVLGVCELAETLKAGEDGGE